MIKYWLAGTAVFALIAGAAEAQTVPSETKSSTLAPSTPPSAMDSVHTTKTEKTIDSHGNETDKRQTYTSGATGTASTATSRSARSPPVVGQ